MTTNPDTDTCGICGTADEPTCTPCLAETRENLANIIGLTEALADHATDAGNDGKLLAGAPIPGGDAMAYLAPAANHEAHMNLRMSAVMGRINGEHFDDEPEADHHPMLVLAAWEAVWRDQLGHVTDLPPTLGRAYDYLNTQLGHMAQHSDEFPRFAGQLKAVKYRLEEILYAGVRHEKGVPCITCDRQVDLVRRNADPKPGAKDQGGLRDEWDCPRCKRRYDAEDYYLAVHHAYVAHADYLPEKEAEQRTGVKAGTIRKWAHDERVKRKRINGRTAYCVADIENAVAK